MLKIRVTNLVTGMVFEHNDVPRDHVENLKINSNLKVEILEIGMKKRAKVSEFDN